MFSIKWVQVIIKVFTASYFLLNFSYASEYQVLEAELNFYPHYAGFFKSGKSIQYYVFGARNFVVLNSKFQTGQYIYLNVTTTSVDLGDMNGDGYDDLIEVSRNDISVRYQSDKGLFLQPVKIISGYFMSPPGVQFVEQVNIAEDINKDGFSDLIIPSDYNYSYYQSNQKSLMKARDFECPYESTFSNRYWKNSDLKANRISVKTYVPSTYFKDLNKDGVQDLYCRYKNLVYYYISGPNESGSTIPFLQRIIKSYPIDLQGEYATDFFLEDMDSDGCIDAVFSVVSGLGLKIKTDVQIFWGKGDLPDSSLYEKFTENGGFFTPLILDNSKEKQLLIPTMNLGVSFFLSYILEKKMLIKGNIYSLRDTDHPRKFTKISDHSLSFSAADNLFPGFTVGDFNHDGFSDIALADDYEEIILHYGDARMKGKKTLNLTVPGYGIIYTILQAMKSPEMLIYLPQKVPGYNSLKVYLIRFDE